MSLIRVEKIVPLFLCFSRKVSILYIFHIFLAHLRSSQTPSYYEEQGSNSEIDAMRSPVRSDVVSAGFIMV